MKPIVTFVSVFAAFVLLFLGRENRVTDYRFGTSIRKTQSVSTTVGYSATKTQLAGESSRETFRKMAGLDDLFESLMSHYIERVLIGTDASDDEKLEARERAEYKLSLIVFALYGLETRDVDARCITNVLLEPGFGDDAVYHMSQLIVEGEVVDYFDADLLDGFGSSIVVRSERPLKGKAPTVLTIRQASGADEWLSSDLHPAKGDKYTFFLSNGLYRYREMLFRDESGPPPGDGSLGNRYVRVFDEGSTGTYKRPVCSDVSDL